MNFGRFIISTLVGAACLTTGAVSAQTWVGDWELTVDAKGTPFERRFALTPAQPYLIGKPEAILAVRRMQQDHPLELIVRLSHDEKEEKCDYAKWDLAVDNIRFVVKGFSIASGTVELLPSHASEETRLWEALKKGSQVAIRVNRTCGGFFSKQSAILVHTFSLRGSSAAIRFVSGND